MSLGSLATVGVAIGFAVLVVWVLWPSNKQRLEDHGHIPFDADDNGKDHRS